MYLVRESIHSPTPLSLTHTQYKHTLARSRTNEAKPRVSDELPDPTVGSYSKFSVNMVKVRHFFVLKLEKRSDF